MNLPAVALEASHTAITLPSPLPIQLAFKGAAAPLAWSDLSKDLIEIAAAITLADRLVKRPRDGWGLRNISVSLAVRQPVVWARAGEQVERILHILGGDDFRLRFQPLKDEREPIREVPAPLPPHADFVALFSGGLDSAAAAAHFAQQGAHGAYITHYTKGIRQIESLLRDIQETYGGPEGVQSFQFHLRPAQNIATRFREHSRRSRPFLFGAFALVTAIALGVDEVRVCENGPLALNLPLSEAMNPTRHAHSSFLRGMERLAELVFDRHVRFVNPFELDTKGKMVKVFTAHPELALRTKSCWNQQWTGAGTRYSTGHCGYCYPCLVRRVSLTAARIIVPAHHFDYNVRSLAARTRTTEQDRSKLDVYWALEQFVERLAGCRNWREFVRTFPEAIDSEPIFHTLAGDAWFEALYHMMQQFASQVYDTFYRKEKEK